MLKAIKESIKDVRSSPVLRRANVVSADIQQYKILYTVSFYQHTEFREYRCVTIENKKGTLKC